MTAFLVVRIEGDVPDSVAAACLTATNGVLQAWNALTPDTEKRAEAELLLGDEAGEQRRRHAVIERLYSRVDSE